MADMIIVHKWVIFKVKRSIYRISYQSFGITLKNRELTQYQLIHIFYFLKNKNQYDLQQAEKEGLTTGENMSSLNTSYNKKEEEK